MKKELQKYDFSAGAKRIFLLCLLAYSVSYIGRKGFSTSITEICSAIGMSKTFGGTISTGYLICYGSGQFISGILGDRISPKYMISIGLLGAGIANISMGLCSSTYLLLVFWCINGLFNSMLWAPIVKALSDWIPKENHEKAGTNISLTIPTGTIISYGISWFCLKYFNWRITFFVCGSCLIITSIIWYLGIRANGKYINDITEYKTEYEYKSETKSNSVKSKVGLATCILSTGLIFTVIGILFNGIIKDGVTDWVPTYVTEFFGVSPSTASLSAIILPIVNLSGAYVAQFLEKKIKNEMTTSAVLFGCCCVSIGCLFLFGKYSVILAVILIAISTSTMLGANNMFLTIIPMHFSSIGRSSSVSGFLNSCSYISAAISSFLIGYLAEHKGWNATIISWLIVAVLGASVCFIGAVFWKEGRNRIKSL